MPDGTYWAGDPREWVMMMSKQGQQNVHSPISSPDLIPSGVYRSGTRNAENYEHAKRISSVLFDEEASTGHDPFNSDIDVWNGTNRHVTNAFGSNFDLSYSPLKGDPIIEAKANAIKNQRIQLLQKILNDPTLDPNYIDNVDLIFYRGRAKELGMTEGELREADREVQRLMKLEQDVYWPKQGVTFTSLYPARTASGLRFRSTDNKMRDWSNIEIRPGFFDRTDAAVQSAKNQGYGFTVIDKVREGGMPKTGTQLNHDLIIHRGTPRISFLGNNGMLTGEGSVFRKQGGKLNYLNYIKLFKN